MTPSIVRGTPSAIAGVSGALKCMSTKMHDAVKRISHCRLIEKGYRDK